MILEHPETKALTTEEETRAAREAIRHPATAHIPTQFFKDHCAKGFPWRALGSRVVLLMLKGEERTTEVQKPDGTIAKIILPDIAQGHGKDKQYTTGIVVSFGRGDFNFAGHFVSPEHDYNLKLGDPVFVEPNSGMIVHDEDIEYRVVQPHEIIMVGRYGVGLNTRDKLLALADKMLSRYKDDPDFAFNGMAPDPRAKGGFDRPAYEEDLGTHLERIRSERGKRTKGATIVVPDKNA